MPFYILSSITIISQLCHWHGSVNRKILMAMLYIQKHKMVMLIYGDIMLGVYTHWIWKWYGNG